MFSFIVKYVFYNSIGESSNLEYLCLGDSDYEEELELDGIYIYLYFLPNFLKEMTKIQSIPKSMWEATVMKKHPGK